MAINFSGAYFEDFDTLAISGIELPWINNNTLQGWSLFKRDSSPLVEYFSGTGSLTTGAFYSFGTTNERALGGLGSGGTYFGSPSVTNVAGYIAVAAKNVTGSTLDHLTLSFDGEQWRNGGNATPQSMVLEYGIGAIAASDDSRECTIGSQVGQSE
ncbi:MAG: hypothetical protein Fur0042_20290 [Cyanophyceae cyanobacterium]